MADDTRMVTDAASEPRHVSRTDSSDLAPVGRRSDMAAAMSRSNESGSATQAPHLVIRARRRFSIVDLRELWHYRDLLRTFAARDITLRYRQTALGVIWVILQPLLAAAVFAFVFGRVAHLSSEGVPYLLFAYSGLLGWNAFSGTLTRGSVSLTAVGPMVAKVYFARIVLPLSVLGSVLLDFGVALVLQVILLIAYGVSPSWHIALLPVWLIMMLGLATGIALLTSSLAVRYRDVLYVIPMVIQMLMFASPVGYDVASVPSGARWGVGVNPLTGILQGFRWSVLGRGSIDGGMVIWSAAAAVLSLLIGAMVFSSLERNFADVI